MLMLIGLPEHRAHTQMMLINYFVVINLINPTPVNQLNRNELFKLLPNCGHIINWAADPLTGPVNFALPACKYFLCQSFALIKLLVFQTSENPTWNETKIINRNGFGA